MKKSTGKTKINVSDRFGVPWGSSSLLKPKEHLDIHTEITFNKSIEIETKNLDEFYIEKGLDVIDFLWFDMQGMEPLVLKNAPLTLSK